MKNYIGFANDHSSSMSGLRTTAIEDYNTNVKAVTGAASANMLDTIVSMTRFATSVERVIVNSNPHVLKPLAQWPASGMTSLYDGIGDLIEQFENVPDAANTNVSFLIMATTDGGENCSVRYSASTLAAKIRKLQQTDRWTFVLRVPKGHKDSSAIGNLGIPPGNIIEWETSSSGMEKATAATTAAVNQFYASRASGQKSSTVFYAQATAVDTSALVDITKDVSLYVVPAEDSGIEIRDFILRHRMEYLKGSAFYQLTKTEARVQPEKIIAVRDRTTGKIYAGKEARQMLGLPTDKNVRLHPGDHGNFDLFIQSSSVNRKLVGGTGVVYWKAIGKPFTEADLAYLQPKPVAPAVVQLPAVTPTSKPTPSPLKPTPKTPAGTFTMSATAPAAPVAIVPNDGGRVRYHMPTAKARFFATRDGARALAALSGGKQYDAGPTAAKGKRFFVE
jgi:hypothetical protein